LREVRASMSVPSWPSRDRKRLALRGTHNLAEGAGAAPLAAAVKLRAALAGKTIVCVMSGGNIDRQTLARIVSVR
jgi:threonine dehydratase